MIEIGTWHDGDSKKSYGSGMSGNSVARVDELRKEVLSRCKVFTRDGALVTICEVPTLNGPIRFAVQTPLEPIRQAVYASLQNEVGWGWKNIKKAAKKVGRAVRKVANKKNMRKLDKFLNDPRVQKAMQSISVVNPAIGEGFKSVKQASGVVNAAVDGDRSALEKIALIKDVAETSMNEEQKAKAKKFMNTAKKIYDMKKISVAKSASKLLDKAMTGDKISKFALVRISDEAMEGDPMAKNIIELMRAMYVLKKKGQTVSGNDMAKLVGASEEVSGWGWNIPYRSPIQALSMDATSPQVIARGNYKAGIAQLLK